MIAMQYSFTLPADYDMATIRRRIAEKRHLLDHFDGLHLKAYLWAERGEHAPRDRVVDPGEPVGDEGQGQQEDRADDEEHGAVEGLAQHEVGQLAGGGHRASGHVFSEADAHRAPRPPQG